ncbi:MAG: Crp/Fnr family transcriptional regulator [Oscillospiraceae bacterium]|nr:Crp/Fnr family transcriptional regulator [Oscillospiraceae bacterium]
MYGITAYSEILKRNYGINIPTGLIDKFSSVVSEIKIKKGNTLIRIGEKNNYLFFVVSGILRDYYIDDDGNDITRFISQEGGICGGDSLISNEPSIICTEALENCVLLRCPVLDFKKIIENDSDGIKLYVWLLEKSLAYKIHRENSFLVKNATERYIDFKCEKPGIENCISQKYIASYLGITPESLSRIRRALKEPN